MGHAEGVGIDMSSATVAEATTKNGHTACLHSFLIVCHDALLLPLPRDLYQYPPFRKGHNSNLMV
jgi:hypothetical protein